MTDKEVGVAKADVLVKFNAAKYALAKARSIDEVKDVRDKAEALRLYIKQAGDGLDMQNQCAEIKLRAERRAGEMLAEKVRAGNPQLSHDGIIAKLPDGVSLNQSSRWQLEASLPEDLFEKHVEEEKKAGAELTSASVLKIAKKHRKKKKKKAEQAAKAKRAAKKKDHPWDLRLGDCLKELPKVKAGSVRLVFADPPYNQSVDYGEGKRADKLPEEDYLAWVEEWMQECVRVLADNGSLWVMICDEWADHYGMILRRVGVHRRSWIKWYETFGVNCENNFNRCSRHIFYCVKNPRKFVFNADAVNQKSARQEKYNDKRADPDGKTFDNVWTEVPRLVGNAKERLPDFPTQLPVAILEPIVGCASDPGDMVLDPFSGSAATGVAAVSSGRRYIGIEKSKAFYEASRQRLEATGK